MEKINKNWFNIFHTFLYILAPTKAHIFLYTFRFNKNLPKKNSLNKINIFIMTRYFRLQTFTKIRFKSQKDVRTFKVFFYKFIRM